MPHSLRPDQTSKPDDGPGWLAEVECDLARALCRAAISADRTDCPALIDRLRAQGIDAADIADRYLAAAVCALGDAWLADRTDWSTVTVGSARLQSMLRRLPCPRPRGRDAPTVLVATGPDIAHTFGPMLLAHRLRRLGVSVALEIGASPETVGARFRAVRADAVFVSAGLPERLEAPALIVKQVRALNCGVPIVVGGPLLAARPHLARTIGADIGTSDAAMALTQCGLIPDRALHEA